MGAIQISLTVSESYLLQGQAVDGHGQEVVIAGAGRACVGQGLTGVFRLRHGVLLHIIHREFPLGFTVSYFARCLVHYRAKYETCLGRLIHTSCTLRTQIRPRVALTHAAGPCTRQVC